MLRGKNWARPVALIGSGMLIYTAMVRPGFFAQQGQPLVGVFAVLLALNAARVTALLRSH